MSQYAWHNTAPVWLSRLVPHKLDKEMDEASQVFRDITLGAVQKRVELIQAGRQVPETSSRRPFCLESLTRRNVLMSS
jgi:hypothetical protein